MTEQEIFAANLKYLENNLRINEIERQRLARRMQRKENPEVTRIKEIRTMKGEVVLTELPRLPRRKPPHIVSSDAVSKFTKRYARSEN